MATTKNATPVTVPELTFRSHLRSETMQFRPADIGEADTIMQTKVWPPINTAPIRKLSIYPRKIRIQTLLWIPPT